jgi:hypothetical protein
VRQRLAGQVAHQHATFRMRVLPDIDETSRELRGIAVLAEQAGVDLEQGRHMAPPW